MGFKFGFIGAGNMGGALAQAVAKKLGSDSVCVCEKHKEKITKLMDMGVNNFGSENLVRNSKYVVLGVKPQVIFDVIRDIETAIEENREVVVISMAAGISIESIQNLIGCVPVIRIMPNTPCLVGEGVILYACSNEVSEDEEEMFKEAFSESGLVDKIDESKIDAASALSGCGPAFVYMFAEALADGAVECGLKRDKAVLYAAKTIAGAGKMIEQYGHIGDLKDAVCSPGGTTIAGVHALEKDGLRSAGMDAVNASYKRTLELKK